MAKSSLIPTGLEQKLFQTLQKSLYKGKEATKPTKNRNAARKNTASRPAASASAPAHNAVANPKKALNPHMRPMNVPSSPFPATWSMAAAWVREFTEKAKKPHATIDKVNQTLPPLKAIAKDVMVAMIKTTTTKGLRPMRSDNAPNRGATAITPADNSEA